MSSVTHYKIRNESLGNNYQGTLLFSDSATQELYGLKDQLINDSKEHLGYTYKEPCAHNKEPPPAGIMEFQIQTESKG